MKVSLSTANLIMTNEGWMSPFSISKNMEDIKILLLKNDKWIFSPVVDIEQIRKGHPFIGKGHGHPELYLVKRDNILLTTEYERVWQKELRKTVREFLTPKYLEAGDIDGKFWASPLDIKVEDPGYRVPIREIEDKFWFIGYYLGIGEREDDMKISFKLRHEKTKEFESILKKLNISYKKEELKAYHKYCITDRKWNEFLNRVFPKREWGSTTPYWLFNLNLNCKTSLFCGFIESTGVKGEKNQKATVKDKALILTMKLIAQEIGFSVGVYIGRGTGENQSWQIVAEETARSSMVIDRYRFGLIREIKENKDKMMNVWELEIEDGLGILIDGIIVR